MISALRRDWPFAARRVPFFYGWIIWLLSTLGMLASIPGQTIGIAVFTDAFIAALELERTPLATAYLLGTLASATLLTRAGRWFDRYGARVTLLGASALLAVVLLTTAALPTLSDQLAAFAGVPLWVVSGPLIFLCYFGVRFSGQGVMVIAATNLLLLWFERRRGLVAGIRGVFVAFGFSLAPWGLAMLMDRFGWQQALVVLAGVVGIGFLALVAVFVRDRPELCGLSPDGLLRRTKAVRSAEPLSGSTTDADGQTLSEARRTRVFWAYSLGLASHALFGTAFTFHVVDIFAAAGRSREEAFAYFLPSAVLSTLTNLGVGALADRISLKPVLLAMLALFIIGTIGLIRLDTAIGYGLLIVGYGVGSGLWNVNSSLAFVRHHGRTHLGEISGFNASITVIGSALGPIAYSLARDWTGSYTAALTLGLAALVALTLFSASFDHPQPAALRKTLDRNTA
ncbi:MAG: MFS transporter [Pseudomonadota bacterium]